MILNDVSEKPKSSSNSLFFDIISKESSFSPFLLINNFEESTFINSILSLISFFSLLLNKI